MRVSCVASKLAGQTESKRGEMDKQELGCCDDDDDEDLAIIFHPGRVIKTYFCLFRPQIGCCCAVFGTKS